MKKLVDKVTKIWYHISTKERTNIITNRTERKNGHSNYEQGRDKNFHTVFDG